MFVYRWWRKLRQRDVADRYRDRGDFVAAIPHYRAYLARNPNDAGIWIQIGHALKEARRYGDAGDAYYRALALTPGSPEVLLQIGHLEKVLGRISAAYIWYDKALRVDPTFAPALAEMKDREPPLAVLLSELNEKVARSLSKLADLESTVVDYDDFKVAVRAMGLELRTIIKMSNEFSFRLGAAEEKIRSNRVDDLNARTEILERRLEMFETSPGELDGNVALLLNQFKKRATSRTKS